MKPAIPVICALVGGVLLSAAAPQIPQSARGVLISAGLMQAGDAVAQATPSPADAGHGGAAGGEAEGVLR
uniref:hypothetical protein n=1 Tax=Raoultella ornithinolytica TaxID=54291 RepID=UPI001954F43D